MLAKVANEVPRATTLKWPCTVNMDISFEDGRGTVSSGKGRLKEYYWFGSKKRYTYPVKLKKSPCSL
ncbi:MAG TPA: hypothetical protein VMW42_09360, partial [Desulfatiglandales bacterium]|nr:hypothetical protein [Desulfatiglandales bacterium]